MSIAHVVALLGLLAAVVGAAADAPALWAPALATAVMQLLVAESQDEALRGLGAFLTVPIVLTVAILATS